MYKACAVQWTFRLCCSARDGSQPEGPFLKVLEVIHSRPGFDLVSVKHGQTE